MPLHESLKVSPKIPLYSLIFTSVFVVFISIVCLLNGITIVFQNLYYFPIIIACAFYLRKGFIFSLVLIGVYVILIALFGPHQSEVYSALARIAIFILVAGVVTWLSSRYSEQTSDLMVSEKKFRRLFDANDAGIALHEVICDSTGKAIDYRFINVNPAYEQMTGLKASDIIGKTVREVFPGNEDDWIETCSDVTAMEKKIHFEYFNRKLGRYYEGTAYSPEPERLVRIIRDVTERKQQEYQLLETNAYLENLITHANVPIIIWDTGFSITRVNHAFEILTGRPAGHLVGRHLSSLFPQDEAERSMQFIQKTGEGVRWETVEIPIIHQDGTLRTVLWNSATIYDSDGKNPVATIAQGRDVTAERFLEREKERAAVQIQENIAQLAILNDGIRNPLTLISIYADMSEDVRITAQIQNEVKRIDEMVTNLDRDGSFREDSGLSEKP
jgi:PAS domain S-box-containing protein